MKPVPPQALPEIGFRAGPVSDTTEWTRAGPPPSTGYDQYLSRDVAVLADGDELDTMYHMRVLIKPAPDTTYNMARMLLHNDEVAAIARTLAAQVPLTCPIIQYQSHRDHHSFTTFPVFLTYGRPSAPVETWTPTGQLLTPKELVAHVKAADELGRWVEATVDFEVTLSYRGPDLGEGEWESTPMSLRFRPRKIVLRTRKEVRADFAALDAAGGWARALDLVAYAAQQNMLH